jgi:hypothetical protein
MTTTLKPQAIGVYKGPLYPELHDEEAELCRYSVKWLAARFITEGASIKPTGEDYRIDPSMYWLLLHADDFDIIKGELSPCDWCSSFDFRCTNTCDRVDTPRRESPRDGAIIQPVADVLSELARLVGQSDPFAPYRPGPDDLRSTREGRAIVEEREHSVRFASGGYVGESEQDAWARTEGGIMPNKLHPHWHSDRAYPKKPKHQYTTRLVAVIAVCWLFTGIVLGWWGTMIWQSWQ